MTAIENYSNIIDSIFGKGTTTFDVTRTHSNNIIGALNHKDMYLEFTSNFIERLKRIKEIYRRKPSYLKDILVMVNEISSSKNWEGAFAELAVYDHFNADILGRKTHIYTPIKTNITLADTASFALELGKKETNLDGFVEDNGLHFDVKCLKDNVDDILKGIYRDFLKHLQVSGVHIIAEYSSDIYSLEFQTNRRQLLAELKNKLTLKDKPETLSSSIIKGLTYQVMWGPGVSTVVKTYDPFAHAENHHGGIFKYANKFLKKKPSIIVLVQFPWYNNVISRFAETNIAFYRAFARRVFCQYIHDTNKFNTIDSSFNGQQTIHEISTYLSGIVFLEDKTILSKDPYSTNVESYVYLNPNAVNKINRTLSRHFLQSISTNAFEDFEYDNY
jgi:hypothetical protein